MARILIACASAHGQTLAIGRAIADRLRTFGHVVDVLDASRPLPAAPDYDAVVLGSRVHNRRCAPEIERFASRYRVELAEVPTGFFTVSMSPTEAYTERFAHATGWRAWRAVAFKGGLPYRKYGSWLRLVMKTISWFAGHTTDTSRDHVFTDWRAVDRFADEIAGDIAWMKRGEPRYDDEHAPPALAN